MLSPAEIVQVSSAAAMLASAVIHTWSILKGRQAKPAPAPAPVNPVEQASDLNAMRALYNQKMRAKLGR